MLITWSFFTLYWHFPGLFMSTGSPFTNISLRICSCKVLALLPSVQLPYKLWRMLKHEETWSSHHIGWPLSCKGSLFLKQLSKRLEHPLLPVFCGFPCLGVVLYVHMVVTGNRVSLSLWNTSVLLPPLPQGLDLLFSELSLNTKVTFPFVSWFSH